MSRLRKIIFIALLVAQGVIIGLIENMIPYPFAFAPGAKLGLANLITIIALFTMPKRESFMLIWMRLILTTLLGGTISTFLYSMSGALLSYGGMLLVKQLGPKRVSIIGISATGGFMHNVGQLVTASWIAQSWTVMLYLPILSFLGILSGIAIGISANYLLQRVDTLRRFQTEYEEQTHVSWKT
ncbi:Gx transporter family protein [Enterococcus saccharolyticus]|uniref:Heptaprenyl diphosphate synthase component I n=1 Tax=Enterococcus saccharolyticus subsp. saccharolyticus ATCC 43076 TaxID=1139996 RepID=S0NTP0_9ENTE|nr:Gx transporter family protein [Enterococcus saccharolyticus]EOT30377.1 heptaprenyl diphosphate synthase component I [Enterococcus saccharolyticus subsp. saccharolyticus ATCC 43076]EOT79938.1 heptaprenyl diphosphate synthase component I [Enterococcus saccharolyticus subsp. saccharolyticus ATCC 43076]OJG89261.1 heptaprenyl diphosphate synthase component I [Enterococcus saccharolyticus]